MKRRAMLTKDDVTAMRAEIDRRQRGPLNVRGVEAMLNDIDEMTLALSEDAAAELCSLRDRVRDLLNNPEALPDYEANNLVNEFKLVYRTRRGELNGRSERSATALKDEIAFEKRAVEEAAGSAFRHDVGES